jgi:hypothetical protein
MLTMQVTVFTSHRMTRYFLRAYGHRVRMLNSCWRAMHSSTSFINGAPM